MLYICVVRFDITKNFKNLIFFLKLKQRLNAASDSVSAAHTAIADVRSHAGPHPGCQGQGLKSHSCPPCVRAPIGPALFNLRFFFTLTTITFHLYLIIFI